MHEVTCYFLFILQGLDVCSSGYIFPPVGILHQFSHHSNEPALTISIPKDIYNGRDWMGLVLFAYCSAQNNQTAILEGLNSTVQSNVLCHLETDVDGPSNFVFVTRTKNDEFIWLHTIGEFLWLSYISRAEFPDEFNECGYFKASIRSDWPGVMVQKCGFRFLHEQDDWFQQIRHICKEEVYLLQNFLNQIDYDEKIPGRSTSSSNEDLHHEIPRGPIDRREASKAKDQCSQSNLLVINHYHLCQTPIC